jgi:hypothetical protein
VRKSSTLAVLFAALSGTASAQAATLIPVPEVPGSTATLVTAINDDNVIAGYYETASDGVHGFYGTLGGNYTTLDFDQVNYPGTELRGINDKGLIVGVANVNQGTTYEILEFERSANGTMNAITSDGSPIHGIVGGINSKGVFAAEDFHDDLTADGFTGKKAKAKTMVDLGFTALRVRPRAALESGDVIGYTKVDNSTGYQGFILHSGTASLIDYPDQNATQTLFEGANSKGIVSGIWEDSNGDEFGFVYDSRKAAFTPFSIPGYPQSAAGGVNAAGLIAVQAYTSDFSQIASYIYCPKKPSKCPSGGFEIADARPVALVPGFKPHAVPNPAALTPLKMKLLSRQ